MTEVSFHFNAPDKVGYACRLLRKATRTGARVVVTAEAETLSTLDTSLWTFSPLDFIAHCHVATATPAMLAASPVVLADSPRAAPHQQVLVNLGAQVPDGFERFERLIEVVTTDEDDRLQARERWQHYKNRGYALTREDLAARESS